MDRKTWWLTCKWTGQEDYGVFLHAAVGADETEARSSAPKLNVSGISKLATVLEIVPLLEAPVCRDCPNKARCNNPEYLWNSRRGGDPEWSREPLDTVHTCAMCKRHVLNTINRPDTTVVPEGCPRWNSQSGSACVCNDCQTEGHPAFLLEEKRDKDNG